jgi:hypothetical protein
MLLCCEDGKMLNVKCEVQIENEKKSGLGILTFAFYSLHFEI